ncbi:ribbon-helix-helix protein, CopG family [Rhodococcus sp. IEGM 1408]|uniref:ribbon-helix-helix protein, CopG family n=1 Tax=Rhodococcus sp. IEGM 1408 TaxID=3082220 RepID=UPI002952F001|nr:ribbon-helix-helix protein, CopG family [Rhodococcus sp. IEGM 1408]MDV8002830.1 ribbon-helix-helix protein, CopG family [Rhodococcus sp. IEGM 1408]
MSKASDREARYARLADAVESGEYEVVAGSVGIRPDYRPGRPRGGDVAEETRPLAVRLTESDRRRLADYAERTRQPMSAVIRAAIEEYLGTHPAA